MDEVVVSLCARLVCCLSQICLCASIIIYTKWTTLPLPIAVAHNYRSSIEIGPINWRQFVSICPCVRVSVSVYFHVWAFFAPLNQFGPIGSDQKREDSIYCGPRSSTSEPNERTKQFYNCVQAFVRHCSVYVCVCARMDRKQRWPIKFPHERSNLKCPVGLRQCQRLGRLTDRLPVRPGRVRQRISIMLQCVQCNTCSTLTYTVI